MHEPQAQQPSNRRRGRLPRLRQASKHVRNKLVQYRRLFFGMGVLAVVLTVTLGLVLADDAEPEVIPLGTGKAGLKVPDSGAVALPIRPPEPLPEPALETTPPSSIQTDASPPPLPGKPVGSGQASYYSHELAGNPTASGEAFDPTKLTAAHPTLPMGSKLRVTNTRNGKSVVVRVNDRGPFSGQRVIDLSYAAARQIGMVRSGTARVKMELIR